MDVDFSSHSTLDSLSQQLKIEEEYRVFLLAEREILKKELAKQLSELDSQMRQAQVSSESRGLVHDYVPMDCHISTSKTAFFTEGPVVNPSESMHASINVRHPPYTQHFHGSGASTPDTQHSLHPYVDLSLGCGLERIEQLMMENDSLLQERSTLMELYSEQVRKLCQEVQQVEDPNLIQLQELQELKMNYESTLCEHKGLQELLAEQNLELMNDMKRMKMMSEGRGEFCGLLPESELEHVINSTARHGRQHAFCAKEPDGTTGSLQPVALLNKKAWCSIQHLVSEMSKELAFEDIEDATLTASTNQCTSPSEDSLPQLAVCVD